MGTLSKAQSPSSSWAFCLWLLSTRPLSPPRLERLQIIYRLGTQWEQEARCKEKAILAGRSHVSGRIVEERRAYPAPHPYLWKFRPGSRSPRVPGSISYPGVSPPDATCILAAALPRIAKFSSYTSLYFEDLVGLWARASVTSCWMESHPAWGLGRGQGCDSRACSLQLNSM